MGVAPRHVRTWTTANDRTCLTRLGVRFGVRHVYLASMLQPRVTALRTRLWAIRHRAAALCPPAGATVPATAVASQEAAEASGYEVLADICVRIDIEESAVEFPSSPAPSTDASGVQMVVWPDAMVITLTGRSIKVFLRYPIRLVRDGSE